MFCRLRHARVAGQPRVRRDHVPGARQADRREGPAKTACSTGPRSRSNTRSAATSTTTGTTTSRTMTNARLHRGRENAQAILDRLNSTPRAQKTYPCWYDPANPGVAVLVRGYGWVRWLVFTVPLSFIIIGAGGLIHVAVAVGQIGGTPGGDRPARRRARAEFFWRQRRRRPQYPSVPQGADMTNSPGTKLKFRLPMATSPGWALFGTLAFCIVWNGIVAAIRRDGRPGPSRRRTRLAPDAVSTIPFAAIGVWAIVVARAAIAGRHRHRADAGRNLRSSAVSRRAVSRVPLAIGMADGEDAAGVVGLRRGRHVSPGNRRPHRNQEVYRQELFARRAILRSRRDAVRARDRVERARGRHALLRRRPQRDRLETRGRRGRGRLARLPTGLSRDRPPGSRGEPKR